MSRKSREQRHYELADHIVMKDWAGNILYQGHYGSGEVNRVLGANRCKRCKNGVFEFYQKGEKKSEHECDACNGTGYSGDFSVYWLDEKDTRNVYEYINY